MRKLAAALTAVNNKGLLKPLIITLSVTILNLAFGFDSKFTIINLIWLLPLDAK